MENQVNSCLFQLQDIDDNFCVSAVEIHDYNNTLYKRVMIDKMEHVATDRFLARHLLDVINNNENENEAHFNSLVDHNYSRHQAENLSYKDLNRFN
jgi:hypothetical protein